MKNQNLHQAKNKVSELIKAVEEQLTRLRHNEECLNDALKFIEEIDVMPHEPGRGIDNGKRKSVVRGMTSIILDIVSKIVKPICANDILLLVRSYEDYESSTINSVTGLLTLLFKSKRLDRIKDGKKYYYFINEEE